MPRALKDGHDWKDRKDDPQWRKCEAFQLRMPQSLIFSNWVIPSASRIRAPQNYGGLRSVVEILPSEEPHQLEEPPRRSTPMRV